MAGWQDLAGQISLESERYQREHSDYALNQAKFLSLLEKNTLIRL